MRWFLGRPLLMSVLALLLVACTTEPFLTGHPRDAASLAKADPATAPLLSEPGSRFVSLCYGTEINDPEELSRVAQDYCPDGGRFQSVTQDVFWNGCPLLQPSRITYICVPGTPPEEN